MVNKDYNIALDIKGIELSRRFYEEVGRAKLEKELPGCLEKAAVGLVGEGSECFGFDDKISMDHDYGPSFCIWLPKEEYEKYGEKMQDVYHSFEGEFMGITFKMRREQASGRRGVNEIESFYCSYLGKHYIPQTTTEWLLMPESYLAVVTNGEVFEDNAGRFTEIRNTLLDFYPEDIRLKKISGRAITMAHYGQCNYSRMMRRGDIVAAHMALDKFIKAAISMVYLLNKKYAPYYKWMWRGMENLEKLSQVKDLLYELVKAGLDDTSYMQGSWDTYQYKLNLNDKVVELVEQICAIIKKELNQQGLSTSSSDYLEEHAYMVNENIKDEWLKSLPVAGGEDQW